MSEFDSTSWLNPVRKAEFNNLGLAGFDACVKRATVDCREYLVNHNYPRGQVTDHTYTSQIEKLVNTGNGWNDSMLQGFEGGKLYITSKRIAQRLDKDNEKSSVRSKIAEHVFLLF